MNNYPFRAIEQDWPKLEAALLALGVLALNEEGQLYDTSFGGGWRYIGPINRVPTGTYDEGGNEIMGPVCDEDGNVYLHANLLTAHDITALAAAHPDYSQALDELWRWVVTDDEGNPVQPKEPAERVWR